MENLKLMSIYDRLCMALTAYESADESDPDYDAGAELYKEVVEITSDMGREIN